MYRGGSREQPISDLDPNHRRPIGGKCAEHRPFVPAEETGEALLSPQLQYLAAHRMQPASFAPRRGGRDLAARLERVHRHALLATTGPGHECIVWANEWAKGQCDIHTTVNSTTPAQPPAMSCRHSPVKAGGSRASNTSNAR